MGTSRLHRRIGTFRQLEILLALAENGSIQKTAESLFLTQPTVSMQLKKLSDQVGMALYEQIGRRLHLTDAGLAMVASAREVFESIERLDGELNNLRGLKAGTLRLAVVTTAKYFFPYLLGPFCARYPGIDVQFTVGNREQIIARLHANKDDLYVFSHPPEEAELQSTRFIPNPLFVISSRQHPWAKRRHIALHELQDQPFILREPGSGTRYAIDRHLNSHNLVLNEKLRIESNEAIKHAVIAGLGLAILSGHTLFPADREMVARLPVEGFPIVNHWYLVHYRQKRFSTVAQTFIDYMLGEGRQHIEGMVAQASH